MEEKILETIVSTFTTTLLTESKILFSDVYDQIRDETKQFIGNDLKRYLKKQKDKYSYIKTLLQGNTPVYLYNVYYPLRLDKGNEIIKTNSITTLFEKSNYITIIGDAGSGKSTLIKHLFLNSIYEKFKIPILIELRYLNDKEISLEEYITEVTTMNKISVNGNIYNRFLNKGKFVFFFDGFDELEVKTKKCITKEINDFVNKNINNNFILTSRPYSNIEHMPLFSNYRMKNLSLEDGEIKGFVFKQLVKEIELATKIMSSIEQGKSQFIRSFFKNPLLLSLYILTFQSYASIPDKKYIFYRRVINALFSEHDSKTKLGFVREKLSGLNQEQFEEILKTFSFITYFDSKFNFDKDYVNHKLKIIKSKKNNLHFDNNKFILDLKSSIALWVDDDGEISFAHRSLQEYFCALFIKELTNKENKRVYEKMLNRFSSSNGRPLREVDNLLSLLLEMDEYNYNTNFYYPILLELKSHINENSKKDKMRSFIKFFLYGIGLHQGNKGIVIDVNDDKIIRVNTSLLLNQQIYKTISVHIPFTKKLHRLLLLEFDKNFETISNHKLCKSDKKTKQKHKRGYDKFIPLVQESFEDLFSLIDEDKLYEITENYINFINGEIVRIEHYLQNTVDVEKDIVDLI